MIDDTTFWHRDLGGVSQPVQLDNVNQEVIDNSTFADHIRKSGAHLLMIASKNRTEAGGCRPTVILPMEYNASLHLHPKVEQLPTK